MDDLANKYMENVFNKLVRESLVCRRRRQALVEHFKETIQTLADISDMTTSEGCRIAVAFIVRYHKKKRAENGYVCLLGKYHNVLYLAVKLCYDFRLTETEVVTELLEEIFRCENTFERIWAGAIFGINAAYFTAAWKSDFCDQKENILAVEYFLEETSKRKTLFRVVIDSRVDMKKFADVPIGPCNRSPLIAALQMLNTEVVLLLLRFDACFSFSFFEIYPQDEDISDREVECVKILFRAIPSVASLDRTRSRYENLKSFDLCCFSNVVPPLLKHLCRCEIRKVLRFNSMLPLGIPKLGLPKSVCEYIDLLQD